jgi:hypothetical protein
MYVGYNGRWSKGFNEFLTLAFDNERDQAYSAAIKHPGNDSSDIRTKFQVGTAGDKESTSSENLT